MGLFEGEKKTGEDEDRNIHDDQIEDGPLPGCGSIQWIPRESGTLILPSLQGICETQNQVRWLRNNIERQAPFIRADESTEDCGTWYYVYLVHDCASLLR